MAEQLPGSGGEQPRAGEAAPKRINAPHPARGPILAGLAAALLTVGGMLALLLSSSKNQSQEPKDRQADEATAEPKTPEQRIAEEFKRRRTEAEKTGKKDGAGLPVDDSGEIQLNDAPFPAGKPDPADLATGAGETELEKILSLMPEGAFPLDTADAAVAEISEIMLKQMILTPPSELALGMLNGGIDKVTKARIINAWTPEQLKEAIDAVKAEVDEDYTRRSAELGRMYGQHESLDQALAALKIVLESRIEEINSGMQLEFLAEMSERSSLEIDNIGRRTEFGPNRTPSPEEFLAISDAINAKIAALPDHKKVEDKEAGRLVDGLVEGFKHLKFLALMVEPRFVRGARLQQALESRLQALEAGKPAGAVEGVEATEPVKKKAGQNR